MWAFLKLNITDVIDRFIRILHQESTDRFILQSFYNFYSVINPSTHTAEIFLVEKCSVTRFGWNSAFGRFFESVITKLAFRNQPSFKFNLFSWKVTYAKSLKIIRFATQCSLHFVINRSWKLINFHENKATPSLSVSNAVLRCTIFAARIHTLFTA